MSVRNAVFVTSLILLLFWLAFKNKYCLGYEDFVDFFFGGGGGHHKIGLYLGVISMHFRVFS